MFALAATMSPSHIESVAEEIAACHAQIRELQKRIRRLAKYGREDGVNKPLRCAACGYSWHPHNPLNLPANCPRCASSSWAEPTTATRTRKPRTPVDRHRALAAPAATPEWKGPDAPLTTGEVIAMEIAEVVKPTPAPPRSTVSLEFPPRPSIAAMLPPPPPPSLSAQLASLRPPAPAMPEQPEVVASRTVTAPPPEEVHITEIDSLTEEEWNKLPEVPPSDGADAIIVSIPPMPDTVPPDQIGTPQTDAEREELARAEESPWPTTRPEE